MQHVRVYMKPEPDGASLRLAGKLNCKVIAEWFETHKELNTLPIHGVHYGQGYHLARPGFPNQRIWMVDPNVNVNENSPFYAFRTVRMRTMRMVSTVSGMT